MDNLIEKIKEYVMEECRKYKEASEEHYDFWNEHIRYVYKEAVDLAKKYGADETVVAIGALLHDIALIEKVGTRKDHHLNGKILSDEILDRFSCSQDLKDRVLGCVLNHRSSKYATNIEEICVCDADCLAHLDNIPMLFNSAFNQHGVSLNEVRDWMRDSFEHDYNDLSDRTKETFLDRYNTIKSVVLGDMQESKTSQYSMD